MTVAESAVAISDDAGRMSTEDLAVRLGRRGRFLRWIMSTGVLPVPPAHPRGLHWSEADVERVRAIVDPYADRLRITAVRAALGVSDGQLRKLLRRVPELRPRRLPRKRPTDVWTPADVERVRRVLDACPQILRARGGTLRSERRTIAAAWRRAQRMARGEWSPKSPKRARRPRTELSR
jgi:hypothetical protein